MRLSNRTQALRCGFCLLMLAAAIGKLLDMPGFMSIVSSFRVLPELLISPVAWALMLTELGLALWLIKGQNLSVAALCLFVMHFLYLVWTVIALARGLDLSNCGCFGVYWPRPLRWYTPLEDMLFMALALLLWRGSRYREARV